MRNRSSPRAATNGWVRSEVLEQRIVQLESRIDGLRALITSKQEIVDSFREEVKDLSELLVEGFVDKQRLRELQRSQSRLVGEVAEHRAAIAQAEVEIGETRLQILQLNKQFTMEVADQLAETQGKVYDLRERISAIEDRVRRTADQCTGGRHRPRHEHPYHWRCHPAR